MNTKCLKSPVWIHGDLAPGNIIIHPHNLMGIIDFGGICIGDPACDLMMAWTFFNGKSRGISQANLEMDDATWLRAKAWCLWKATFELCQTMDHNSPYALNQKRIIQEIL